MPAALPELEAIRERRPPALAGALSFGRLEAVSIVHSCVYAGLLICAFAAGNPQPLTFALGLGHGLLWIGMSCACILAARLRIIPLGIAVAVAVLGGVGPFFGSAAFMRESRRRRRSAA